jgi:hypothetical protein
MNLMNVIRKPATTPADLTAKLERLRATDPGAACAALEAKRKHLLVSGSDRDVDDIDAQIAQNRRDAERITVAIADVEKQLADLEQRERDDALKSELDTVKREAAAVEKALEVEYVQHANPIIKLLARLNNAEKAVASLNEKLTLAGSAERVAPIEPRVFPAPSGQFAPPFSLLAMTRLRALPGVSAGWNSQP